MKKLVMLTALAGSVAIASPAMAWGWGGWKPTKPPASSSGGHSSTSTGGHSSTSGGTSGGSHSVPEPGMLGLMGAGVVGLAIARRRRKTRG